MKVWRDYEAFVAELTQRFPHERAGIRKFYDACWQVFNALNSLDLKSLEEPRYLLGGEPGLLLGFPAVALPPSTSSTSGEASGRSTTRAGSSSTR